MHLPGKLSLSSGMLLMALAVCAGAAVGAEQQAARAVRSPSISALAAMQSGTPAHPYSFADLFHLTVGAQYGLVTGTVVEASGATRGDWVPPSPISPALFRGSNVPGLALGPAGPAGSAMIGIPDGPSVGSGDYGVRLVARPGPQFEFEKPLLPLGRMPRPAGWLILVSVLLVALFIARRRSPGAAS